MASYQTENRQIASSSVTCSGDGQLLCGLLAKTERISDIIRSVFARSEAPKQSAANRYGGCLGEHKVGIGSRQIASSSATWSGDGELLRGLAKTDKTTLELS